MKDISEKIYAFVQERYLWQFHSRVWDREANINGILTGTLQLLSGKQPARESAAEKCWYVDAYTFANDIKTKFPEFLQLGEAARETVFGELKAKLTDVMITRSLNCEVRIPNY